MNIPKILPFLLAALLGLATAASADDDEFIDYESEMDFHKHTSCPNITGCTVYGSYVSTIDPFCCSENITSCQDYKVEVWRCAAGALRYRNFAKSGAAMLGGVCDKGASACY